MADGFKITDKRGAARQNGGLILGQSLEQAKRLAGKTASAALDAGREGPAPTDMVQSRAMGNQRTAHQKLGSSMGGGSLNFATERPRDPFFYWRQNNLPYDFEKPEEISALRELCRHIYRSHPLMASAIDIYSKWPLTGMELVCKDPQIEEFFQDLMFDQLDYEEFLPDLGREYWTVGEAFPMGSFNETLGVWEADELLNPNDVFVQKSPFLKDPHLYIRLPESLRKIITTGQPAAEYQALMRSYPELRAYARDDARMPVSNVLLKHLKFKTDAFSPRGLPILYRALRPLLQEEMLNSAQDAIADRLYTPLILAKIGASATDLGTDQPWVPTPDQIASFEASLDTALAADFRVLTTHFAVDMQSVFGRETMPNFDMDFNRLGEKQLQAFGLSMTMMSGGSAGETYAADAINRDLISQLLSTFQRYIKRFVRDRMLVVAEAQGFYDYEVRGGKRYPIMEEVLVTDEETGEQKIVEQPKLLVPELRLKAMNMKDEETERTFLETMVASGIPVSIKRRFQNVEIDLEEERELVAAEQVDLAVEAQRVRKRTYEKLKEERLPIPADLLTDFEPKAVQQQGETQPAADATSVPMLGQDGQDHSALAPTAEEQMIPPGAPLGIPAGPGGTVDPSALLSGAGAGAAAPPAVHRLPTNNLLDQKTRPPESDEMRATMPKASTVRQAVGLVPLQDETGAVMRHDSGEPIMASPGGIVQGPRHVGRTHLVAHRDPNVPLDDEAEEAP